MKTAFKNDLYLQVINSCDITNIWHEVSHFYSSIGRNTRYRYSQGDILQFIQNRQQQVWLARSIKDDVIQMITTTEIVEYPQCKALLLDYCAGRKVKDWIWIIDEMEDWARKQNCQLVEIYGRKGWEKYLPNYRPEKIIFSKRL